ncbi:MAG: hypothetical protein U0165_09555 [Polyangiaceae bacterium]
MKTLLIVGLMLPFVAFWALAMKSYADIARDLKKTTPDAPVFFSYEVFRHAFTEMRGSRATRWMSVGFAGVLITPVVLAAVAAWLRTP